MGLFTHLIIMIWTWKLFLHWSIRIQSRFSQRQLKRSGGTVLSRSWGTQQLCSVLRSSAMGICHFQTKLLAGSPLIPHRRFLFFFFSLKNTNNNVKHTEFFKRMCCHQVQGRNAPLLCFGVVLAPWRFHWYRRHLGCSHRDCLAYRLR